jgi:hypothetical protein
MDIKKRYTKKLDILSSNDGDSDRSETDSETDQGLVLELPTFIVYDATPLKFGKYKTKTHLYVFEHDKKYVQWVINQGANFFWLATQSYFKKKLVSNNLSLNKITFIEYIQLLHKTSLSEEERDLVQECELILAEEKN